MSDELDLSPVPQLDKLATALAAVQAELPTVVKGHTAQVKSDKGSYSYTYAGLADVAEAVYPILAKHGLSFTALPGGGQLTGMLLHSSGQSLAASLPISGGTPQALGSSLTYMRRYLLGCMTGLVTDDDDDGQAVVSSPAAAAPRQAKAARPKASQDAAPAAPDLRTEGQSTQLWTLAGQVFGDDKDAFRVWLSEGLGREDVSTKTLTKTEASEAIAHLTEMANAPLVGGASA